MTVDFVVFGIGFPTEEYQGTRYNAGYTFCDYLANCVAMQSILLDQAAANAPNDPTQLSIPENFQRPRFMRLADSAADVHDAMFSLTEADLHTGPKSTLSPGADSRVQKRFRLLIVKPLVADASQTGLVLASVLRQYNVVDVAKKVVVVYGDPQVLPGSISLAHESDVNRTQASPALASICSQLGNEFVRIRMGLGQPSQPSLDAFLLEVIQPSKEMDVFGYCLDVTGQAVQHYAAFQDLKATKKKHGNSKKLPSSLRKLPGLVFPIDVYDPQLAKAEKAKAAVPVQETPTPKAAPSSPKKGKGRA
ncbi:hypothetical protein HDV03_004530 [Kappamyces sp. JEL0829]|nr:hypothetical protein HDV03_004530 [Kappamyces sp. JEL0829]